MRLPARMGALLWGLAALCCLAVAATAAPSGAPRDLRHAALARLFDERPARPEWFLPILLSQVSLGQIRRRERKVVNRRARR